MNARRPSEASRRACAVDLELPRFTGSPEDVAEELRRSVLARASLFVYVGAYVRRFPVRRTER